MLKRILCAVFVSSLLGVLSCELKAGGCDGCPGTGGCGIRKLDSVKGSLSDDEKAGIIFMREEEKLARDVYLTLAKKWKLQEFSRISKSEQRHMDALKNLIVRYELVDPVVDDTVGSFKTPAFKKLYDELVAKGGESVVAALQVGSEIEDLDIKDLDTRFKAAKNAQLLRVYANLNRGSRNHLRAFTRRLKSEGASYTPTHISLEKYKRIVSTPPERGAGRGGNGAMRGGCGGDSKKRGCANSRRGVGGHAGNGCGDCAKKSGCSLKNKACDGCGD